MKFHMVAFNLNLMDAIWTEDDGKISMLATWDNIFNYFAGGFQVCKASSGTVSVVPEDCEEKILDIDQNLRDLIKGNSFQDLTGCNYGYPDNVSDDGALQGPGQLNIIIITGRLCPRLATSARLGVVPAVTL